MCPNCGEPIRIDQFSSMCNGGHKFPVVNGILDLLQDSNDNNVLNEEDHWNRVADKGRMKFVPNEYISTRLDQDYHNAFKDCIETAWEGTYPNHVNIVDIGCGTGSAITYLHKLEFQKVDYIGIDVSIKIMRMHSAGGQNFPDNWNIRFIRASANKAIFQDNSLDIVFSASALHHLELATVIKWISRSLKPNGLLILHEPSSSNPFAKIGRKLVRDFHTKGEKPLLPKHIEDLAYNHSLILIYEKGLHYFTGSLQYLIGRHRLPFPFTFCAYQMSRFVDALVTSPSWNYSFVQVYKKLEGS
jgi:SAM-dependent methyltransferase